MYWNDKSRWQKPANVKQFLDLNCATPMSKLSVCVCLCCCCNCPLRHVKNGWDRKLVLPAERCTGWTNSKPATEPQLQPQPQPQNSWNVYSNPEIKFHLEISYTKWASDLWCMCVCTIVCVAGQTCMFKLWNQKQRQQQQQHQQSSPADWSMWVELCLTHCSMTGV